MSLDLSIANKCLSCHSSEVYFDRNITHNLTAMWKKAGVYDALYNSHNHRPIDYLEVLGKGLNDMRINQGKYEELNPSNGWGDYHSALAFLESFERACRENSFNSVIRVSK